MPRCGRSIVGGSERRKSRFHDPRARACRGLMHPFVGGNRIPSFSYSLPTVSPPTRLVFFSFAAASHPRSHKRFYDLHPVRVRGPILARLNITRLCAVWKWILRHHLRGKGISKEYMYTSGNFFSQKWLSTCFNHTPILDFVCTGLMHMFKAIKLFYV